MEQSPWEVNSQQLFMIFHSLMEPEGSLLFSQETTVGPSPEPDEIQSMPSHSVSLRSILIFCHQCLGLPSVLFHSSFWTKICHHHKILVCRKRTQSLFAFYLCVHIIIIVLLMFLYYIYDKLKMKLSVSNA